MFFSPMRDRRAAPAAPSEPSGNFSPVMTNPLRLFLAFCLLFVLPAALGGCAAKRDQSRPAVIRHGQLPSSGTVVLRSGLEWTNENSPLFQSVRASLTPALTARGLQVAQNRISSSSPRHPSRNLDRNAALPEGETEKTAQAESKKENAARALSGTDLITAAGPVGGPVSTSGGEQRGEPAPAASAGETFRPLRLEHYTLPVHDADLPGSVMAVRPPDLEAVLFAASQRRGYPVLLNQVDRIPGRLPKEMYSIDPLLAKYTLIIRFAALRSPLTATVAQAKTPPASAVTLAQAKLSPASAASFDSFVTAAGPVRGVGSLGYGSSTPGNPPRPVYGGTPGDYARGYEGMSPYPRDIWHRESDFNDPSYRRRHSPPPAYASPPHAAVKPDNTPIIAPYDPTLPKAPLPGDSSSMIRIRPGHSGPATEPGFADGATGGSAVPDEGTFPPITEAGVKVQSYLLELECFELAPPAKGKAPAMVWNCRVQRDATPTGLEAALPGMALLCISSE